MREIKFRAWDTVNKRYTVVSDNEKVCVNFENGYLVKHCTLELEQYTGLKDKNGKEIYEGDTIEYINAPGMEDCVASVVRYNSQAVFYIENDDEDVFDMLYNVYDYSVVIGNIHETTS